MIRIKALNESSSDAESDDGSDSDPIQLTREAQEEQLYSLYHQALQHLKDGRSKDAKDNLLSLLDSIKNLPEDHSLLSSSQLKFLACKNLGLIEVSDINYFLDALEIDASDVGLWIKTGIRAFDIVQDYQLARNCFEAAYILSPSNWIVVDRLLDSCFVLHDLFAVVKLSVESLRMDPSFKKGQVLLYESCRLTPAWRQHVPVDLKPLSLCLPKNCQDFYLKTIDRLRLLKLKRKQRAAEDEVRNRPKHPKLALTVDFTDDILKVIGNKILRIYEHMQREAISLTTPIDVILEKGHNQVHSQSTSTVAKEEAMNTTSTDESNQSQEVPKDNNSSNEKTRKKTSRSERNAGSSSQNTDSSGFPIEFLDKRRSSRVQRLAKSTGSEQTVYESLMEIMPSSVRDRVLKEEGKKEDPGHESEAKQPRPEQVSTRDVEKQIFNDFLEEIKRLKASTTNLNLFHIIHCFLLEVSKKGHNIIVPPVYTKLYDVYRKCYQIPSGFDIKIGKSVTLDDVYMTLTANELVYRPCDEFFLSLLMPQLEDILDEEKFNVYFIRLLFLRGTKGNEPEALDQVIEILEQQKKPTRVETTNQVIISVSSVKSLVGAKCESDLTVMMNEGKFNEVVNQLYNKPQEEISPSEEDMLFTALTSCQLWEKAVVLLANRRDSMDDRRLKLLLTSIESGQRAKINAKLFQQLTKLAVDKYKNKAWSCLYWVFFSELNHQDKKDDGKMMNFLKMGHDFLGKKSICTGNEGEFLLLSLDYMLNHSLGTHKFLDDYCLDCFVCLFGYPSKRSSPHGSSCVATKIKMKWDHSNILYSYFFPDELPEYDSNKTESIDAETEQLGTEIMKLIPEDLKPDQLAKFINKYCVDGGDFPVYDRSEPNPVTQNLFYLLADYYFKNKEFKKAKFFYIQDLGMNPDRFDSWAGISLTRSHQLETMLGKGDHFTKEETDRFYKMSETTFRCYRKGLEIDPENSKLWIEFGNLAYNVSSQLSRIVKCGNQMRHAKNIATGSDFDIDLLKTQRKECLNQAKACFEAASRLDLDDEQWLPCYILGKIHEKSSVLKALAFYEEADLHLYLGNAQYPRRIAYHTPASLSIEAIEVYYRIHACILKFLSKNPQVSRGILFKFKTFLTKASRSAVVSEVASFPHTQSAASREKDLRAVSETVSDLTSLVVDRFHVKSELLRKQVVLMCIQGLQLCLSRFPEHYKSMHRLAYHYYVSGELAKARDTLLNMIPDSRILATGTPVNGLFSDRKNNNFFNGIWRIPIDEVDRPGSFPSHMYRSAFLLIRVSTTLFDYNTLCSIASQLSRVPEAGKKYLREGDRLLLAREAFDNCSAILKNHVLLSVQSPQSSSTHQVTLAEINKICEKFIRANVFAEEASKLFNECHNFYRSLRH